MTMHEAAVPNRVGCGRTILAVAVLLLTIAAAVPARPQAPPGGAPPPTTEGPPGLPQEPPAATVAGSPDQVPPEGVPVVYRGRELFRIYVGIGPYTAQERAELSADRLDRLVRDLRFRPELVRVEHGPTSSDFIFLDQVLGTVTDADARAAGRPRREYAEALLARLQAAVVDTRLELSWENVLRGLAYAAGATVVLALLLWLLGRAGRRLRPAIDRRMAQRTRGMGFRNLELLSVGRLSATLHLVLRAGLLAAGLLALAAWLESVLAALPWTRRYAALVIEYLQRPVAVLWQGIVAQIPNLFFLLVIGATAYGALKVIHFLFLEVERGTLRLAGFRPEWADATYKLVRPLVIAMAAVAAFPYIPGSRSPAFQGISLFLGVLISLSSSSAIANLFAGAILTYTGAFRLGDRVQIGDRVGDVVETSLLVTRLRTIKNVVVSIPNAQVLAHETCNYSTLAEAGGVILHTSVTIGYDAPWHRVHDLLLAAARATDGLLSEPAPFVLETALGDFYVTYEINAYTRQPQRMAGIYSKLHRNIHDAFDRGGLEIMSPHYTSLRDGTRSTIPPPGGAAEPAAAASAAPATAPRG